MLQIMCSAVLLRRILKNVTTIYSKLDTSVLS